MNTHRISIVRDREVYTFCFVLDRVNELLNVCGRYAASHELSFTWADASKVALKARKLVAREAIKAEAIADAEERLDWMDELRRRAR